jgi:HEAT repeat protein
LLLALAVLLTASTAGQSQQSGFLGKSISRWTQELGSREAGRRRAAAFALGRAGPAAVAAVPKLVIALRDPAAPVREAAAYALGEIGPTAWEDTFPALLAILTADSETLVRRSAAFALGSLAKDGLTPEDEIAGKVRTGLENALKDRFPSVRQNAAWALGRLSSKRSASSVTALAGALKDADPLVRRESSAALGNLGASAHDAASWLVVSCKSDKDLEVRKTSLTSLANILNPNDRAIAVELRPMLRNADAETARLSALALAVIGGPDAAPAVPILCGALREHDVEIRRRAASGLEHIGLDAPAAVASLTAALGDPDPIVRRNAALALAHIGARAEPAVRTLAKILDTSGEAGEIRFYAAEALAQISPAIEPAIPVLLRVLRQETDPNLRERAVLALGRLEDIERAGIAEALANVLAETDPYTRPVRYAAAVFLGIHLGPNAPARVLDVLTAYLGDKDLQVYLGASTQVGSGGRETQVSDTSVRPIVEGDSRFQAAIALARIGKPANRPDIVRALQAATKSPDSRVRETCTAVLRELKK